MMWKFIVLAALYFVVANANSFRQQQQMQGQQVVANANSFGQQQQIQGYTDCPNLCENLDISFIVDASSSIHRRNFTIGLNFLQSFVDLFDIGSDKVRVSMLTFANGVYSDDAFGFDAHKDKHSLNIAIDEMPYRDGGSTHTDQALNYYLENVQTTTRSDVRSILIVLTDGGSAQKKMTKQQADRVLKNNIEVFAIGVGHSVSVEELHVIASDEEHVFIVTDYFALDHIKERLHYEACGVKPTPICALSPVDICFVIDSSRSIHDDNFDLELTFIKDFLEPFKINPSSVRVAAVMFGNRVYKGNAIQFDQYSTKKDTLDAILALPYMSGESTETGPGITYMIKNFAPNFRKHAIHIGIIITDGESTRGSVTKQAAKDARAAGITTIAVGIGKEGGRYSPSQKELEEIAGDPLRVIRVDDFAQLTAIRDPLTNLTCEGPRGVL